MAIVAALALQHIRLFLTVGVLRRDVCARTRLDEFEIGARRPVKIAASTFCALSGYLIDMSIWKMYGHRTRGTPSVF